jgi:OOP family OmpA-OmpF porin
VALHAGEWRVFLGGGYRYISYETGKDALIGAKEVSENALFGEVGLQKLLLDQRVIAEAGVRAIGEVEDTYLDFQPFLGISVLFGRQYPEPVTPPVLDSDSDGVVDGDDMCPGTPVGTEVDATGCAEKDSDNDGVLDKRDACPDTPAGAKVDDQGCAEKLTVEVRENLYIAFPSNSSAVPDESVKELENIAVLMKEYPTTELQVFGHTDSRGSASYNMQLSDARASAVRKVLSSEYSISLSRINSQGMGETAPVATNETSEGRAQNRRVELVLRQPK